MHNNLNEYFVDSDTSVSKYRRVIYLAWTFENPRYVSWDYIIIVCIICINFWM